MRKKLKNAWIKLYVLQAGGQDKIGRADLDRLNRAIEWRLSLVDALTKEMKRRDAAGDKAGVSELLPMLGSMSIRRQIEDELGVYTEQIQTLSQQANDGEIDSDEFQDRLTELTVAILMLSFLTGSVRDIDDLNEAQRILYDASLLVLMSNAGNPAGQTPQEQAQFNAGITILSNQDLLNDGLTTEEQQLLQEQIDISSESAISLAQSVADGSFAGDEGAASLAIRMLLWTNTAAFLFSLGQLFREDNPFFMWVFNPIKDHCVDCVRLNGQVHTADEWRRSGWVPRGFVLNCRGFYCGCAFVESEGPSRGEF